MYSSTGGNQVTASFLSQHPSGDPLGWSPRVRFPPKYQSSGAGGRLEADATSPGAGQALATVEAALAWRVAFHG